MTLVRAFAASDTEAVDLITAACTRELRRVYSPKPSAEPILRNRSDSSRIVAVDDAEAIVGVAECIRHASAVYVQGIAVAPTHRRCGVAADLLAYGASLAAGAGCPALELATIKETGNVEIFCRLGFRVIEERVSDRFWSHDERPVTEVTLRRRLA
ncbi:MAG: GNAT family N-acetyltransferase [Rhodocyclaceae bacterium]|nr:GNAT family N-acetyltransferase [Rhodocyclaceae bacterium]